MTSHDSPRASTMPTRGRPPTPRVARPRVRAMDDASSSRRLDDDDDGWNDDNDDEDATGLNRYVVDCARTRARETRRRIETVVPDAVADGSEDGTRGRSAGGGARAF